LYSIDISSKPKYQEEIDNDKKTEEIFKNGLLKTHTKKFNFYKDKYLKKRVEWEKKDKEEENVKQIEIQNKNERKLYIREASKLPRTAQIFIDNYSLREGEVNRNIIEINKLLGKNKYDQSKINKKVDELLLDLEKRKKKEITEIKTPQTPNKEIKENIKRNLENQVDFNSNSNEDDLYFVEKNYKQIADINTQTQKDNFNAFKEFKDKILEKKF